MNARIVPVGAKSFNDVLNLDECMEVLMLNARKSNVYTKNKKEALTQNPSCVVCGNQSKLDVHHKKPVWVYALEVVLNSNPQNKSDLNKLVNECLRQRIEILECHARNNLEVLCTGCHVEIGVQVNQEWKNRFLNNERLFFGIRNASEIEKLLDR